MNIRQLYNIKTFYLEIQRNNFNYNFHLNDAVLIRRESNLLKRKFLESALIETIPNVGIHPEFFQISPFLIEILLSLSNIRPQTLYKPKENG